MKIFTVLVSSTYFTQSQCNEYTKSFTSRKSAFEYAKKFISEHFDGKTAYDDYGFELELVYNSIDYATDKGHEWELRIIENPLKIDKKKEPKISIAKRK